MNASLLPRVLGLAIALIVGLWLLFGGTVTAAPAPASNKTTIIGVWEISKSADNIPPGATIEFTRDGKLKVTIKVDEKTLTMEGTYKVEGNKITVIAKLPEGKELKETLTLVKLTATELITRDEKGKLDEFKKKK